jgi:hypothetical protein
MSRKLIAVIALFAANAAFAMPDLEGDAQRLPSAPEATSYVPVEQVDLDCLP